MCKVALDLTKEENLDFAIFSLVLSQKGEFSSQKLVSEVRRYQHIDEKELMNRVDRLLERWVDSGLVQEHWDTFSVVA